MNQNKLIHTSRVLHYEFSYYRVCLSLMSWWSKLKLLIKIWSLDLSFLNVTTDSSAAAALLFPNPDVLCNKGVDFFYFWPSFLRWKMLSSHLLTTSNVRLRCDSSSSRVRYSSNSNEDYKYTKIYVIKCCYKIIHFLITQSGRVSAHIFCAACSSWVKWLWRTWRSFLSFLFHKNIF